MGNHMLNDCCHSTFHSAEDLHDLRHQTSNSIVLTEQAIAKSTKSSKAKSRSRSTNHFNPGVSADDGEVSSPEAPNSNSRYSFTIFTTDSELKLTSIDSAKSTIFTETSDANKPLTHHQHPHLSTSISEESIYSIEESDSETDDVLTNEKVFQLQHHQQLKLSLTQISYHHTKSIESQSARRSIRS